MTSLTHCPACGSADLRVFYEIEGVPVHSVLLLPTREAAIGYPRGDIRLGFCEACGFITNTAFDPSKHEYSERYEETQGFSATFTSFHRRLAQYLIDRYDLHSREIIEIGCGKGEFLTLLCELGPNRGTGFDPAYVPGRARSEQPVDVTFIQDFYSEKYAHHQADFYVCKMTLEHIQDVYAFVSTVRRSVGERRDATIFFQIPEVRRILRDQAFWDIYYEHCSYFSQGSLARLFRRAGFDVINLWTDYDDQYLMIEARPGGEQVTPPLPQEDDLDALRAEVNLFAGRLPVRLDGWRRRLERYRREGRRVVLWGGGSKGVAFLTTLGAGEDLVQYAVDINPYKEGTYMAGTGQRIVRPEFLREFRPDVVVVMNSIYCQEIRGDLEKMGLDPLLLAIETEDEEESSLP